MVSGDDEVQAATISADRTASVNAGSGAVATAAAVPEKPAREQVLVVPGDTLWSIAEAHAPHGKDVRGYIQQLKQVNHLASSALQAGQLLILP